jgi:Zn-dependent membrane protease YugP
MDHPCGPRYDGFRRWKSNHFFLIGILLFAITTVFSLVTLPVEFDASNRALAWLEEKNMTTSYEHDKAADALKWAARTYVVAAVSSVATLLYYIFLFMNRRD